MPRESSGECIEDVPRFAGAGKTFQEFVRYQTLPAESDKISRQNESRRVLAVMAAEG
jgi:hypothetical protein